MMTKYLHHFIKIEKWRYLLFYTRNFVTIFLLSPFFSARPNFDWMINKKITDVVNIGGDRY